MQRVRTAFRLAFLTLLLALFFVAPVLAQSGGVTIDDPDGLLRDRAAVQAAAQRLADEGADVIVVAMRNAGTGQQAAQLNLNRRLRELGVAGGQTGLNLGGNQILFFISPENNVAVILYVPRFRSQLDPAYQQIVSTQMLPRLSTEDYSGAVVAGIDAVRNTLNPPTSPVVWVAGGALAAGAAGAVAAPALRRRKATAEALAKGRRRMEAARTAAGGALADLGRYVTLAREKAQYDRISYAAADAARIGDLQQRGESLFTEAQSAFDAAEEARSEQANPTASDLEALAARYDEIRRTAEVAREPIVEAERMRAALDAAGASAPSLPGASSANDYPPAGLPATGETTRL